jgi:hypothetical protein
MKSLKKLTLGLATAAIGMASAQAAPVIIHVVGSTAFRTGTSIAIIDTLAGTTPSGTGTGHVFGAADSTTLASASRQIFANGTIGASGTATIIVETSWTGSLAGVVDLTTQASTATFLDETNATIQGQVNGGQLNTTTDLFNAAQVAASDSNAKTSTTIELAMSDAVKTTIQKELQNATLLAPIGSFPATPAGATALANATAGSNIVDSGTSDFAATAGDVAIAPFEWVSGSVPAGYTAPTNMTQQIAADLFTNGSVPQALFTGGLATADVTNFFYLVGRNEDSGTRIGSLSESQFGVTANPIQYQVGNDSTTNSPAALFPVTPLNTAPSIEWNTTAHSGYASGGNVATALSLANTGITFTSGKASKNTGNSVFIGYLGLTDATAALTASGSTAKAMSYNGVAYSPANVLNGSYTFWIYEHAYRLSSLSGTAFTTVNTIADNIFFSDADVIYSSTTGVSHAATFNADGSDTYIAGSAGLFDDGGLVVSRSKTEGGPVSHN